MLAALVASSVSHNDGHLIYPLDDAYIHMAMAKNMALHHVWGVTKHSFTSTSSSPLWTVLLSAAYLAFGTAQITPLVLNVIFGIAAVLGAYFFMRSYTRSSFGAFGVMLGAVVVAPLPTLTIVGMEHVLQVVISLAFLALAVRRLSRPRTGPGTLLPILAALVTALRYEGAFLVASACMLFLLRNRWRAAIVIGISGLLPVVVYGMWSSAHGWFFLPNSVLLKGSVPSLAPAGVARLFAFGLLQAYTGRLIGLMLLLSLLLRWTTKAREPDELQDASLVLLVTMLLHVMLASTRQFFRYEAYLIWLGVLVVGAMILDQARLRRFRVSLRASPFNAALAVSFVAILAFEMGARVYVALRDTSQATTNIYEQQYQMGTFLNRFYGDQTVAVNDIGAVSYLADLNVVDLWGLASLGTARLKIARAASTEALDEEAKQAGARIAIVFDEWLNQQGGVPRRWTKVGQWTIPRNVVCWSDAVSFYALDASSQRELADNLARFSTELPRDIRQDGGYLTSLR